jgi:hypothetical protein
MLDVKVELLEIKEESESGPAAATVPARRKGLLWRAAGLAVLVVLVAALWLLRRPREAPLPPPRLVPLTSMRGWKMNPTFSPDGGQIAFAWGGGKADNTDI